MIFPLMCDPSVKGAFRERNSRRCSCPKAREEIRPLLTHDSSEGLTAHETGRILSGCQLLDCLSRLMPARHGRISTQAPRVGAYLEEMPYGAVRSAG